MQFEPNDKQVYPIFNVLYALPDGREGVVVVAFEPDVMKSTPLDDLVSKWYHDKTREPVLLPGEKVKIKRTYLTDYKADKEGVICLELLSSTPKLD